MSYCYYHHSVLARSIHDKKERRVSALQSAHQSLAAVTYTVRDYEQSYRWTYPIIKKGVVISVQRRGWAKYK